MARTLLWLIAAIAPLAIAAVAIVRWDRAEEERAAAAEAMRDAEALAGIVTTTTDVARRQLDTLADSAELEQAIASSDRARILDQLSLFRHDPAWRGLVLIAPDGTFIASRGQVLASDLEVAPTSGGVAVVPRLGFEPARAIIARPVIVAGEERGLLVGAHALPDIEAVLGKSSPGQLNLVLDPAGRVLMSPRPIPEGSLDFETRGTETRALLNGREFPAAVVPVLGGSAQVASIQDADVFDRGITGTVAVLVFAMAVLGTAITIWRVRLTRIENRLHHRQRELGALQELAMDATTSTSLDQILRMAGARAAELLPGVAATYVALVHDGNVALHCTYPEPRPAAVVPAAGNVLLFRVLQHGHRESGRSGGVDPAWRKAGFTGDEWESWTPLVAHGRILGALACLSLRNQSLLEADETRLLDGLAATLAVALESREQLAELSHQRAILAAVVDSSPDGILALDAQNRIFLDNPAARSLLRQHRTLIGHLLEGVIRRTEEAGASFEFDFDVGRLLAESRAGATTRGSFRVRFDGEALAMEALMAPLSLPQGGAGSLVSMRNVTERAELAEVRRLHMRVSRLAEDAAGRAALLEQVLAASDVGLVFLDQEGNVVYANQLFGELLGMPTPPRGMNEESLVAALRERLASDLADLHTPALLHTRTQRILALRAAEVHDPNGRKVGRLISLRDETAQRELEEARETFIGVAAHELKNPLAVLRLQAELGLRDERRARAALDRILVHTKQLQELIERLLDVTRADLNRLSLECTDLRVLACVREAAEPFMVHDAPISIDGDPSLFVRADPIRLKQVVTNLLSNAVRYGGEGRVEVTVRDGDGKVFIAVRDEGPGIPLEEQAHIFDRFAQGRVGERGPGLGIGLYISQRIAEAHGGRIELQSAPGRGSTFTLVLPLLPEERDEGYGAGASMQAAT